MKNKKNGVLSLVVVLAVIALSAYGTLVGFTSAHKLSAQNIRLGLDLAGGVSITYQAVGDTPTTTEMKDTISKMSKRAEVYSTESSVVQEGSNRVVIDIPGAKDAEKVLKGLGKEGSLDFVGEDDVTLTKSGKAKYDKSAIICSGSDVKTAEAGTSEDQTTNAKEYVVDITFTSAGAKKFATATEEAAPSKKIIYIIYDGEVLSNPAVQSEITDGVAQISGSFDTYDEADELASGIRIGALPIQLKEIQSQVVDAQLGQNALQTSFVAGVVGFILVVLFMVVFYRLPGLASSIALIMFLGIYILALNALNVTLTLPGVAGVLLNIGMAVDANVIIFARIKEELADGKSVQSAIKQGFDKAFSAILDGNVTTMIAALILYLKGSGTVKGFAITLAIGIVISMFTALVVTKLLLNALCVLGINNVKFFGVQKKRKTIDFIGHRNIFFSIGGFMIVACVVCLIFNTQRIGNILDYGLEFMGGTTYDITFNDDTTIDSSLKADIEKTFKSISGNDEVVISKVSGKNEISVQTASMNETQRDKLIDTIASDYKIDADTITYNNISGSVSGEMRQNAIVAVIIAAICMLIYISIRFKDFIFASTAVLSLLHDLFCVVLLYAAFRISVGSTFIAVMLTILGYSINSTIVIFDRIREHLKGSKKTPEALREIVNRSITETLTRTINTNLTTFIMLLTLAVFGVSSVKDFAIPLMVGVTAGTFSDVCITATLWYTIKVGTMHKKKAVTKK